MQGVPNGQARKWTDETVAAALREITGALGSFPSASELRSLGRNDLMCAATKSGGLIAWSERLGLPRKDSDSDFGWRGENLFCELCAEQGIPASRTGRVKSAYDILLDDAVRVDVKTADPANYGGNQDAWYYRIGKDPQADLIVLLQYTDRTFYGIPWWECPTSNVTVFPSGGKYLPRRNNWPLIRSMISVRKIERAMDGPVASVA